MWRLTALCAALLLWAGAARAQSLYQPLGLYEARAIVTGTDMRSRPDGLEQCLRAVLVKVSGNPALADDRRVDALKPAEMMEDFIYLDRLAFIPHHDEQGSRDRPYDLIARFDPAKVDAALALLGEHPWLQRPALTVFVTVDNRGAVFPMSADGDAAETAREALTAASGQFGMRVVLQPEAVFQSHHHAVTLDQPAIATAIAGLKDVVPLTGTLGWSDKALGWVGEWRLSWQGRNYTWRVSGVSLDDAWRNALRGAMQILSGHGAPA